MCRKIQDIYTRYQFSEIPLEGNNEILVFHHGGYFKNVDIVPVSSSVTREALESAGNELTKVGYSCRINKYRTHEDIEKALFDGFFNIAMRRKSILNDYSLFSDKISKIVDGKYRYIPSTCNTVHNNGDEKQSKDAVAIAIEEIKKDGPQLIIIDAPAGYGKTTVIYELANNVIKNAEIEALPLIAELHRNRKVSEFRYVLLSEFDRVFGGINYELAISKIQSGDIVLIIDGFDEMILSRKKTNAEDNESEPLLQSLLGIIKGEAKVILTSRRTALIDTDSFRRWVSTARESFNVTHISIQEPVLEDWLGIKRVNLLTEKGIEHSAICNPVILSNLKNQGDEEFLVSISSVDNIVDMFLDKLLAREIERQSLQATPLEQRKIFRELAWRFAELNITEEQRGFVEELIKMDNFVILERSRILSSEVGRQMSLDEYMAKLSIHALLDCKVDTDYVCFVNDFIFGYLIADYIRNCNAVSLVIDEAYIDLVSTSISACCENVRNEINVKLRECLEIANINTSIQFDLNVNKKVSRDISGAYFDNMEFDIEEFGKYSCTNTTFANSKFYDTTFWGDKIEDTNFMGCSFWNCEWHGKIKASFHNGNWNPNMTQLPVSENKDNKIDLRKDILERFWPQGRPNFTQRKMVCTLHKGIPSHLRDQFDKAVEDLSFEGILWQDNKESYLLNMLKLTEIKKVLGR